MKKIRLCLTACFLGIGATGGMFKALSSPRKKEKETGTKKAEKEKAAAPAGGNCDGL